MTEKLNKWCVYKHTAPSGKIYIGITSLPPKRRWKGGGGYKNNPYFAKAIQKYGWENIQHEILCDGLYEQEAKTLERFYISQFSSNNASKGYNLTVGGDGVTGYKYTDAQRKNRSLMVSGKGNGMYGHKHTCQEKERISFCLVQRWKSKEARIKQSKKLLGEKNVNAKSVCQFSKDGLLIKSFPAASVAERELGISHSSIIACCRGKILSCGGFIWKYSADCNGIENISYKNNSYIEVYQYDKSNNLVAKYFSIREAERLTGVCRTSIRACLNNIQKTAGGFIWKKEK